MSFGQQFLVCTFLKDFRAVYDFKVLASNPEDIAHFPSLGFLAFIATAAPLPNPDTDAHDVGDIKDEKRNSDAILYKREPSHESLQTASYVVRSLCTPEDENCDEGSYSDELEKHGGGRKARPSTRKRPAKKRPTKKKPVKKPTTKTPATKKPNTGIRPGTGTGGKKGGKKTPVKAQPGKSKDYLVVEAAAKKKGKKLVVGRSYLLTEMSHAVISHHKLIVAKVIRKGKGKNKQLDVEATMQQLVLKEGERGTCFEFLGGTCTNVPLKEYSCSKRVESGKGAFKFSGTAKPEFGDPDHFIVQGNDLLIKNTKYNIITNNCQTSAAKLANVARQKEKR